MAGHPNRIERGSGKPIRTTFKRRDGSKFVRLTFGETHRTLDIRLQEQRGHTMCMPPEPHVDGDYSYRCGAETCRCMVPPRRRR